MRLELLEIHNIASIKDATIDFTASPLSDADVFLISGKTGSGKTTILDAICLALFDTTPRLKSTRMQGGLKDEGERKANASEQIVSVNSTKQLLSRGAGEGYVKLTFKGNNNCRYEAAWGIQRGYKNPKKALGKTSWTLKNLDSGHTLSIKEEIKHEIGRAVGLDFNQFCRTTMLAQGAFSKFLDSTDDEKSAILEKITGVDIYTRIGKKIYEITSGKKEAFDSASRKAEDVVILSVEDAAAKREMLASLGKSIAAAEGRKRVCDAKSAWLKNEKLFADESEKAKVRLASLREEAASPENETNRKLLKEIDATREVREEILALRNSAAYKRKLRRDKSTLSRDMRRVVDAVAGVGKRIEEAETKISDLTDRIEASSVHENLFRQKDAVITNLNTLNTLRNEIKSIEEESERYARQADGQLKSKLEEADTRLKTSVKAIADLDNEINRLAGEIEKRGLAKLRKERNAISDSIADLTNLKHAVANLEAEAERRRRIEESIDAQKHRTEELNREIEALGHDADGLKKAYETAEATLTIQRESIDEWANAARARLSIGDVCPVCNQKVSVLPPANDLLREIYEKTRTLVEEKRKEYETKAEALANKKGELKQVGISIAEQQKEIADRRKLTELEKKQAEAALKCGFDPQEIPDSGRLTAILDEKKECKSAIDKEIDSLAETEKALNEARLGRPALEKDKERKELQKTKAQKDLDDMLALIETKRTLLIDKGLQSDKIISDTAEKVNASEWEFNWLDETERFAGELKAKADAHDKNKEEKINLENSVRQLRSVASTASESIDAIETFGIRPADDFKWKRINDESLIASAADLLARVRANAEQRKSLEADIEASRHAIVSRTGESAAIEVSRLLHLALIAPDKVEAIRSRIHQLDIKTSEAEGAVAQATANVENHARKRPEFAPDDSAESIEAESEALQKSLLEYSASKGAVEQELAADEENRKRMLGLVEEREKARKEYEKWSVICNLIGNADGKVFRKIAQSYVLSGLVDSANHYMRQLTDRYRLIATPGSFLLSIEDAYQGYALRAASTISGGETFIVSLSLALALSDIGGGLTVDTLFIDEGFGTLSGEPLARAIDTLRMLHTRSGRKIGIISHIEELKEQLPVQIRVDQRPGSPWSTVEIS